MIPSPEGGCTITTDPDPLLTAGMAVQRAHRARLHAVPRARRRDALEQQMLALARTLRASHLGYARHFDPVGELALDTVPPIDKTVLTAHAAAFCGAAGIELPAARLFLEQPFELGSRFDDQRVLFSSSGSTGSPLLVPYHLLDLGRSLESFVARAVSAQRPRAERMLYVGLMDRHNGGNAWMHHLGSVLRMRMAHLFDEPGELLRTVLDFAPDVVLTRPHVLLAVGELAREGGHRLPRAHLLSVGDRLTAGAAAEIAELWGAPPHNSYSTVETGPLAYQPDPDDASLELYDDLHLVELLDPDGRPIAEPGVRGRIAVTTLYRCQFPLVRYLVGDTAEWTSPALDRIGFPARGTSPELVLHPASGTGPVTVRETDLAACVPAGVRDVQLVQTAPGALLVRYTLTHGTTGAAASGDALCRALDGLLRERGVPGAGAVAITAQHVTVLEPDRRTGKVKHLVPLDTATTTAARIDALTVAQPGGRP